MVGMRDQGATTDHKRQVFEAGDGGVVDWL
jgi:hypothetical protein